MARNNRCVADWLADLSTGGIALIDPRYEVLRVAMRRIAWPIQGLREMAEDQGRELDGHMARTIGLDPHYLIKIAQDAMAEIATIDPTGVNDRPRAAVSSPGESS